MIKRSVALMFLTIRQETFTNTGQPLLDLILPKMEHRILVLCLVACFAVLGSAKPHQYSVSADQQPLPYGNHLRIRPHYHHHQSENNEIPSAQRPDGDDYEDFPVVPPLLRVSFNVPEDEYFKTPGKRYLGIDIPDYISTGGKADAIKSMSDKMKAMGKK